MSRKKTTTSFKTSLSKLSGPSVSGVKRGSLLEQFTPSSPIKFGMPSDRKALVPESKTGADWSGLAKQVVSGGVSSLLGSSSSTALFGGLGSLISGITSLFGGEKKAPPALQLFKLPEAVNQTVHLQSASSGSPAVNVHAQTMDTPSFVNRSNDIARAVKTAMLNSHSLNDVIAEL
jgi:hypothetical protein